MKTSIKTLAYAAVASMLLLACNETAGLNASNGDNNTSSDIAKGQPDTYDPYEQPKPPYDPSSEPPAQIRPYPLIINKDVEKWMEEQLVSKSGEKRLIIISDMHITDITPPGLSASGRSDRNGEYFVEYSFNGDKISAEEYYRIQEEYRKGINTGKRNLYIPGEEISKDDSRIWTVLMTAEELAELLSKKYDELAIRFYEEPIDE